MATSAPRFRVWIGTTPDLQYGKKYGMKNIRYKWNHNKVLMAP
jgi:hypothetical protein